MIAPRPLPTNPAIVASSEVVDDSAEPGAFKLRLARVEDVTAPQGPVLSVGTSRAKRSLDVALISACLPVLLPVMVAIAVAIRLDSKGPILLYQRRVGRNGRAFKMWKFRSMVEGAEAKLQAYLAADPAARTEWEETHKLKNDPRVTPLGRILRRTSLDELPQLWNILVGDMSLVGPRPIVRDEIDRYQAVYPLYTQSRPGLTGLWQVSGRSNTSYARRIVLDKIYIRRWSLAMDVGILLRTIPAVLFGRGAY